MLLPPKEPLLIPVEIALKGDAEGDGDGEDDILVVDEGKHVGYRDHDYYDDDEICLVNRQQRIEWILKHIDKVLR